MKKISWLLIALLISTNALASYVQAPYPLAKGGTNASTKAGAFDSLSPMSALGDIIYGGASGTGTALAAGSDGQVLTLASGIPSWATPSASGTVTSVSVVSANGFAGTVATATSTPAITLTTSITGLLKGNGTAISAATSGTDYSAGTSALATGILKSTTTTGALTIAVAGDFPTLNQNTTGSAASFTGSLVGDVTGTQGATAISASTVTGKLITGFSSGAGTVAASDTILQAINKLDGNTALKQSIKYSVTNGGNAAYTILAADQIVRAGTTLTAGRAYTLDACTSGNVGEYHRIKNPPTQTFNITLTAGGSDTIDNAATYVLLPGDSVDVACGANTVWDIL